MIWFFPKRLLPFVFTIGLVVSGYADIAQQVRLDFFFTPGCTECEHVKHDVLPKLEDLFDGQYELVWHDLSRTETVPLLIAYQDRCGNNNNGRVSLVVDHTVFLSGLETISTGLLDRVSEALAAREQPGWKPPLPPGSEGGGPEEAPGGTVVRERMSGMTLGTIIGAGLLDGINPCAISTLIFFMSVLVVAKATRRTRLLVGLSFIAASFVVYMGLGVGVFLALRQASGFPLVKRLFETGLGLAMIPLAVLSFRDAFRFRQTQRPSDVTLQIPKTIKDRIHRVMHSRIGWGGPVIGGLVTGAAVTVLESVCTGQTYLPVLSYLVGENVERATAVWLLVLYNLCFVLPLTLVFVGFHRGIQVNALIEWSKRNLVVVKVLLGLFFAAMAAYFLWPAVAAWLL